MQSVKPSPAIEGAFMRAAGTAACLLLFLGLGMLPAAAQNVPPGQYPPPPGQNQPPPPSGSQYSPNELLDAGHRFFGGVSRGLAGIIERAVSQWGLPNGYILGQEGGAAFVGGLRLGAGVLYTDNAGDLRVV